MRHAALPALALTLTITLLFGLGLVPHAISPAHAADTTLVFASYQAIMTYHVERQDPVKLLAGALNGLRQALAKAGMTERPADLTAVDEPAAKTEFQARFDRAAGLAHGKLTVTQLQNAASAAMAESVGGATGFFTREQWGLEKIPVGLSDVQTGIASFWLDVLGRYVIFSVAPYSPAEAAGLRPFDRIVAIDGKSVQGMTRHDIAGGINGWEAAFEGTTVMLTVQRPGRSEPLTLAVVRQRVQRQPPVRRRMLGDRLGYIWIRSLAGGPRDAAEFRRALVELQREGMRGLIIDVRITDSRGYAGVLGVANALLPAGVPIQTLVSDAKDSGARVPLEPCPMPLPNLSLGVPPGWPSRCTNTTSGGTLLDAGPPLVVLISAKTRHFGEILSAAIRETRRGKLLGVRTPGRVGIPNTVDLPGGAAIYVERIAMLTGKGAVLRNVGVQPDLIVELNEADLDRGVDTQLQRAVQILSR